LSRFTFLHRLFDPRRVRLFVIRRSWLYRRALLLLRRVGLEGRGIKGGS
jgi:hypothetical protein